MNERDFLKNFAKILKAEDTFEAIEEQRQREQKKLEQLSAALGVQIEQPEDRQVPETLLAQPRVIEQIAEMLPVEAEPIVENVIPLAPQLPVDDIITKSVERIAKASPKDIQKVVDAIPDSLRKELDIIKKSITDLHSFASRQSQMGGGGEVNFRYLDDVARSTMTANNDNWVLEYDAASKKVQFTENVGPIRSIKLNTSGHTIDPVPGLISWNPAEDCVDIHQADGTTLQAGLEHYFKVWNNSGATLTNGTVVRFSGVYENNAHEPTVVPHIANNSVEGLYTVGVVTADIANGATGRATWIGKVWNVDTTGSSSGETWQQGDILYVHPTLPGKLTKVKPYAPNIVISIAAVLHVGATDGILLVRPVIYPRMYYGSFSDKQTQTAAAINTPYAVKLRTTDIASGHHVSNETRVVAEVSGAYNYQFSLQVASSSASAKDIWIWARKNGVDVPDSTTRVSVTGNGEYRAPAWNFVFPMAANDYFELMWAVSDTTLAIVAPAATSFCPAIPSAILTVTEAAL